MDERGWVIGIDVGGTKIAAGLLDPETGRSTARRSLPTRADRGGEFVLKDVLTLARELASLDDGMHQPVLALGVGVPEIVSPDGKITSAQSFDWRTLPVIEQLAAVAPATIQSDVRAAALAEARLGAGQPFASFAFVSIGTGISSTVVQNGRAWPGARGAALVLSSGLTTAPCSGGGELGSFVLEDYASGPAVERRYQELTGKVSGGAAAVIDAARRGDAQALGVVNSATTALGSAIAFLVNIIDPAAIIVGGGLGSAPGPYWEGLVAAIRHHIWHPPARELPIVQAQLGSAAGWIGAALTAFDRRGSSNERVSPGVSTIAGRR